MKLSGSKARAVAADLGDEVLQDLALVEAEDSEGGRRRQLGDDLVDHPVHVSKVVA